MNAVTEMMPQPLVFTEAAAAKVKQLIDEEGNTNLKLRVFVQGGGCSGFQYGFTFDEEISDEDTRLDRGGVGQVRFAQRIQGAGGDRHRPVDRIRTGVGADGVSLGVSEFDHASRASAVRARPAPS